MTAGEVLKEFPNPKEAQMAKKTAPKNSPPMKKGKGYIMGARMLGLGACSAVPSDLAPDPQVRAKIVAVCAYSGLFSMIGNFAGLIPVPGVSMGVNLLNAGVDQVCGNPDVFAKDASIVEWLIRNFRSAGRM